ncbi:MAG: glycosyltransferase family 39 protein [Planctomycetales bacterium]
MPDRPRSPLLPSKPVLALFTALLLLPYLAILCVDAPLVDPDEGLHAAIAQEMVDHHDWVTPRFLGTPFFDKPILYFWALCGSLKLLGSTEFAIRLPGLCFGLLGILATGLVGARWFTRRTGWLAAAAQSLFFLPWTASQVAVHDIALVPWTLLGVFSLWNIDESALTGTLRRRWSIIAGIALGLAVLTKGLLGVVFILLAWIPAVWWTARRPLLRIPQALILPALIACIVAAPWYVAMELHNPGYSYYYFYQRHLMGFLSNSQPHGLKSAWYYLPVLAAGSLPWWPYLLTPALFTPLFKNSNATSQDHVRILLLFWGGLGLLFLSAAKSKLPSYLLPLFPALSLLVGDLWGRFANRELPLHAERIFRMSGMILLTLLPITFFLIPLAFARMTHTPVTPLLMLVTLTLTLLSSLAPIFFLRDRRWPAFLFGSGSLALMGTAMVLFFLPVLSHTHSGRSLAAHWNATATSIPRTIFLRERIGSVVFYLRPELRSTLHSDSFETWTIGQFISRFHAQENRSIVIPEREVPLILRYVEFTHAPYEKHDRYRLYGSSAFVPLHVRHVPPQTFPLAN